MTERHSVQVLRDCINLQEAKGRDYQNAVSTVKQADYYRLGLNTIYDIMHAKMLRIRSLLETAEANGAVNANFESISDSAKDLINYASFFASYAEGKMDGQNPNHDIFNRPKLMVNEASIDAIEPIVAKAADFLETGDADGAMHKEVFDGYNKDRVDSLVHFLDSLHVQPTIAVADIPTTIAPDEERIYKTWYKDAPPDTDKDN